MNKKMLFVVIVGVLIFGVTGCGKSKETQTKDNDKIINQIKDLKTNGDIQEFKDLMVLNDDTIEATIGIRTTDVDNYIAQVPVGVDSKLYLVFKPSKDKKDRVKTLADLYVDSIKTRLQSQLPTTTDGKEVEGYEDVKKSIKMIENIKYEEYKGYLIYISSSDNKKVLDIIKKGL